MHKQLCGGKSYPMVMSTGKPTYKHKELTDVIIGQFYYVYNLLGFGFLEKVYENALVVRLSKMGLDVKQQHPIKVYFEGVIVGEYIADIIVNDAVILELKATKTTAPEHIAQLINYLKATQYEVGLLLNFGTTPTVTRKAFDNHRKRLLQQ